MVSDKFRHQLRHEAELWQAEGLITPQLYEQLAQRYQFDHLETAARDRFVAIFMGLGGILLASAAIAFVAANWQGWSRDFKVVLLMSILIGVNVAGFYLWRIPPSTQKRSLQTGWQKRLGQGLLLLGALLIGANIGLMAQMFHISGSPYGLFIVWGLGVIAMAYSLRLTSLGVLAILLMSWGYWLGIFDWRSKEEFSWLQLLIEHMPLVASLLFIPLAYWCRSRAVFILGAIAIVFSLETAVLQAVTLEPGLMIAIACGLPAALLWGYDDTLWPNIHSRFFQSIARNLALVFLAIQFYFMSYHWFWYESPVARNTVEMLLGWTALIDVVLLGALAIWEWLRLGRKGRKYPGRGFIDLTTNTIGCAIAISTLIPLWHFSLSPIQLLATFLFNVLLFLLAAGLLREGLMQGSRWTFWGGIILLTLQILSRTLEYNTDLLLKAFVFFLCGVGVIAAGLWFERYSPSLSRSKETLL